MLVISRSGFHSIISGNVYRDEEMKQVVCV